MLSVMATKLGQKISVGDCVRSAKTLAGHSWDVSKEICSVTLRIVNQLSIKETLWIFLIRKGSPYRDFQHSSTRLVEKKSKRLKIISYQNHSVDFYYWTLIEEAVTANCRTGCVYKHDFIKTKTSQKILRENYHLNRFSEEVFNNCLLHSRHHGPHWHSNASVLIGQSFTLDRTVIFEKILIRPHVRNKDDLFNDMF